MVSENKKKKIMFIGSMVVALMFISSYASFGNNNISTSTTTIQKSAGPEYYVSGEVNATIIGYSQNALLKIFSNSSSMQKSIASTLSRLETNASISNYAQVTDGYDIVTGNMDAYALQHYFSNSYGASNVSVSAKSTVKLAPNVVLYYLGRPIGVATAGTYNISISPLIANGSVVALNAHAIVNGTGAINGAIQLTTIRS
ncbi:hypothetical protein M1439_03350 [Candidatus Marsarchaeota archaeon]|jgi:hypothetical protein|nr:hypothetical protein [Candidatus Marsarchaeota archaeon]MCL5092653.1 hypothetical protein [Candidatus Marsarchaeota archaeon]